MQILTLDDDDVVRRWRNASCRAPPPAPNIETPPAGRFVSEGARSLLGAAEKQG